MSKDSQRVQVSNPHCDLDQVTRIQLKLGQYKVTIAIAAACIFIPQPGCYQRFYALY
ncbi:hypothetical protein BDW66DRAFT_145843 [Aspergillus desertorum]